MKHALLRVFHLIYSLEVGGAEVDLLGKSRVLVQAHGCDVTIGCLLKRGELAAEAEAVGIQMLGPLMRGKLDASVIPRLVRLMRDGRYDIVHTHMFASNLLGRLAAMLAGVPVIVSTVQLIADREAWWEILVDCLLQHRTDTMIASSQAVRQSFIQRGIRPAKIAVIYNSVDLARFDVVDREAARRAMRQAFGWDEGHLVVGTVARLERIKGLDHLIEAAKTVAEAIPQAGFLVVGDGPQREDLLSRVRQLGLGERFVFAGLRSDIPQILPALDLFVLPSLSEALGIAAIEALASGVPVVASRVGGVPEVVIHGETGLLVPPGDAGQLAQAVSRVAANPAEARRWADCGRKRVRLMFDVNRLAGAQAGLYQHFLERKWRKGTR
jgi:glycosyltransferase involved in cell wall biosynthesis